MKDARKSRIRTISVVHTPIDSSNGSHLLWPLRIIQRSTVNLVIEDVTTKSGLRFYNALPPIWKWDTARTTLLFPATAEWSISVTIAWHDPSKGRSLCVPLWLACDNVSHTAFSCCSESHVDTGDMLEEVHSQHTNPPHLPGYFDISESTSIGGYRVHLDGVKVLHQIIYTLNIQGL